MDRISSRRPSAFVAVVVVQTFFPVVYAADVRIDEILEATPVERGLLVREIAREGAVGVQRLRAEAATRHLSQDERDRIDEVLVDVRAQLMQAPAAIVRELDRIGDFRRRPARDENAFLCDLLDGPAGRSDYGRAEVTGALLRRYAALAELSREVRQTHVGLTNPREVLRRLAEQPLEAECVAVLDQHLPLLLYHDWVSNIRGMPRIIGAFIESPALSRGTYLTLRDVYIESRRGARLPPERTRAANSARAQSGFTLALSRADSKPWPALNDDHLVALWRSPVADVEDRQLLWDAVIDVFLETIVAEQDAYESRQRVQALLLEGIVPDEMVRAGLDRVLRRQDEWNTRQRSSIINAFLPYLRQVQQSSEFDGGDAGWRKVLEWWDGEGREASPCRPLTQPLKAVACVVLARGADPERLTLLRVEARVEPGRIARVLRETRFGMLQFAVRACETVDDEGALFVQWQLEMSSPSDMDGPRGSEPRLRSAGQRRKHGIKAYFAPRFAMPDSGPSHPAFVMMIIDRPEALRVPAKPDIDWVFAEFYRRCPPGRVVWHGHFPGGETRFLPQKYRVLIVDRYFDGLGPPPPRGGSYRRSQAQRVVPFATRCGGTKGLEYLRKWVAQEWRGWKTIEPLLRECEEIARVVAITEGGLTEQVAALRDPDTRLDVLVELLQAERLKTMSEDARVHLAKLIALEILAREEDPGARARLDQALRRLTGENHGYNPFATAEQQQKAIAAWIEWAEQQQ